MLDKNISILRGVGPARAGQLRRLGISTIGDLLLHVPRTWLDRRSAVSITSLTPGTEATVSGEIVHTGERTVRGGRRLLKAVLSDGTGMIALTFFRPGYVRSRLSVGTRLTASGRIEFYGGLSMAHPDMVFHDSPTSVSQDGGGVIPVYPLTSGITRGIMGKLVTQALSECRGAVPEVLPGRELSRLGWDDRYSLLESVHTPTSPEEGVRARRALALEELYLYQLVLRRVREAAGSVSATALRFDPAAALESFSSTLPFELTGSQRKAARELLDDMTGGIPMRRLLQGDVGCGKTVVAAAACSACCDAGGQVVVMAPTEVLAAQHMKTLSRLLESPGHRCSLLTGGTPRGERDDTIGLFSTGRPGVLIGTHAVLEEDVTVPGLSLLIVDEQHKFGVAQREVLLDGRVPRPHMLVMSATPIPRTLAMTFYGDLALSVIDEMPPGRGRTETCIVTGSGRTQVFEFLKERLEEGERAYIVYPLREATDSTDLRDARSAWEALSRGSLGGYGIGLLYGTMKPGEKLGVTRRFADGEISVLVSTTVVEVGLDVPEATVMIVSGAERFGLSQLHQLRGRIGRGGRDAWCFLVAGEEADHRAMERLETLASTTDGFLIAEKDLRMRGPGQVLGTRQHGLPEFRVADLLTDSDLIEQASRLADEAPSGFIPADEVLWRYGEMPFPGV